MSKVSALQASLQKTSGKAPAAAVSAPSREAPITASSSGNAYKAPSREGKIHPDFKRSLRLVQAQTGEDVQTLVVRALNGLFSSHNVPVVDQD
jgi:hypothetical protein